METVVIDLTTGKETRRTLTPSEQAQRDRDAEAAAAEAAAAEAAAAEAAAAEQAWRDAIVGATSLAQLKDVLVGRNLPARAASRPTQ